MGTRKTPVVSWLGVGIMAIAICVAGCDCDKPTEPKPEELKDYAVYFWGDGNTKKLFEYHPTTKVLDSFDLAYMPYKGVTVSADGSRLYLADRNSVVVLDTDSFSFIAELPYHSNSPVAVSPDNELIAVVGNDLQILRTSDYSVDFSDTSGVWSGRFSADSKTFYCLSNGIYRLDLSNDSFPVVRKSFANRGVIHVVPSTDQTTWFLYHHLPSTFVYAFEVYDVALDSVLFSEVLVPGAGEIAITPDGRYAFYSNPGTLLIGPPAPSEFTIFDIRNNSVDEVVETSHVIDSLTPHMFLVGSMAVTPDGKWLVLLDALPSHQLLLYDLERRSFVDYKFLGNDKDLMNLTVQYAR